MNRFYNKDDGFTSPKYWFYREFMTFMHRRGWHYAPKKRPIDEPHISNVGLVKIKQWSHWCEWCGLRGQTIEICNKKQNNDV